jgi:hypothetical protein
MDIKGTKLHISVQILDHDDGVTVEKYENAVKDAFNRLEMEAQKRSTVINCDKTKIYGKCKPKKKSASNVNNGDIEEVNQLKYLGSDIT